MCLALSAFKVVRDDLRCWIPSDERVKWAVKLDVRDLGGYLDTSRLVLIVPFHWTSMAGFELFGLCSFLVPCMVSRPRICPRVVS